MEISKFNVFNFLNKSKKTTVPLVLLCPTFPYIFVSVKAITVKFLVWENITQGP